MTIAKGFVIEKAVDVYNSEWKERLEFKSMVTSIRLQLLHVNDLYKFDWRDLDHLLNIADNPFWPEPELAAIESMYYALDSLGGNDTDDRGLYTSAEDLMADVTDGMRVFVQGDPLSGNDLIFLDRVAENWWGTFYLKEGMTAERLSDVAREVYGDVQE